MTGVCAFTVLCHAFSLALNATCHFEVPPLQAPVARALLPTFGPNDSFALDIDANDTCAQAFLFEDGRLACFDHEQSSAPGSCQATMPGDGTGERFLSTAAGGITGRKVTPDPPHFELVPGSLFLLGDSSLEFFAAKKDPCFPLPDSLVLGAITFDRLGDGAWFKAAEPATEFPLVLAGVATCSGNGWTGEEQCLAFTGQTFAVPTRTGPSATQSVLTVVVILSAAWGILLTA